MYWRRPTAMLWQAARPACPRPEGGTDSRSCRPGYAVSRQLTASLERLCLAVKTSSSRKEGGREGGRGGRDKERSDDAPLPASPSSPLYPSLSPWPFNDSGFLPLTGFAFTSRGSLPCYRHVQSDNAYIPQTVRFTASPGPARAHPGPQPHAVARQPRRHRRQRCLAALPARCRGRAAPSPPLRPRGSGGAVAGAGGGEDEGNDEAVEPQGLRRAGRGARRGRARAERCTVGFCSCPCVAGAHAARVSRLCSSRIGCAPLRGQRAVRERTGKVHRGNERMKGTSRERENEGRNWE